MSSKLLFISIILLNIIMLIYYLKLKENFTDTKIFSKNNKLNSVLNKYNLFFQYPARTEEICYIQNKDKQHYLGIPWATIIDKKMGTIFLEEFKKINISGNNISSCQHIHYKKIIPLAKQLNIKTLYISHKEKGVDYINGIILKPLPIYAVTFEESDKNSIFKDKDLLNHKREYLFSFIGATNLNNYISDIRKNIYNYRNNFKSKNIIEDTKTWHFGKKVYLEQVKNKKISQSEENENKKKTDNFNKILLNSRYSLCPPGAGPNTIRLWESLAVGAIPVLLADTLELPDHKLWNEAIVIIDEKNYKNIEKILVSISKKNENTMRQNCLKIYEDIKNNFHLNKL